jgi:hypothetical protein
MNPGTSFRQLLMDIIAFIVTQDNRNEMRPWEFVVGQMDDETDIHCLCRGILGT